MEAPAKVTIREILTQFTESLMLRLIGARLRPERSHRPLPKELQQLLRPSSEADHRGAIIGPCCARERLATP